MIEYLYNLLEQIQREREDIERILTAEEKTGLEYAIMYQRGRLSAISEAYYLVDSTIGKVERAIRDEDAQCDMCNASYNSRSREGRCGECRECSTCCNHDEQHEEGLVY